MNDKHFVDEAARREAMRRATDAVDATQPVPGVPPEWNTPAGAAKWVHDLRNEKSPRQLRIEAMQRQDWPSSDAAMGDAE